MALTNRILDLVARKADRQRVRKGAPSAKEVRQGETVKRLVNGELTEYTKIGSQLTKNIISNNKGKDRKSRFDIGPTLLSIPNYDSGWYEVGINSTYNFEHHLGTKFLMIQAYFKVNINGSDRYFPLNNNHLFDYWDGNAQDRGFTFYMKDDNTVQVGTGNYMLFGMDSIDFLTNGNTSLQTSVGEIRLFCWKFVPGNKSAGSVTQVL